MLPAFNRLAVVVLAIAGLLISVAPVVAGERASQTTLQMAWPTAGRVSQPWGCTGFYAEPRRGSCRHFHIGIDIANASGTPIRAAADGVIDYVGLDPWLHGKGRSWVVLISHGHGVKTFYAHLQRRDVDGIRVGRRVLKDQLIGYMGTTGISTGPHLHFGVIDDGVWVNPGRFCPATPPDRR